MTTRRQRLIAEERRDQLMAAAVEVLATHGYGATTADAIARRAGVSKGLLWHYFADLDELLEMTARRTLKTLSAAAAAAIDLAARPRRDPGGGARRRRSSPHTRR